MVAQVINVHNSHMLLSSGRTKLNKLKWLAK